MRHVLMIPVLLLALCLSCLGATEAVDYQWSALVGGENRRVYLWIPEQCRRIRGLVLCMKNLTEPGIIEHAAVRAVCRQERVGILWVAEDRLARGFARSPFSSNWGWPTGLTVEQEKEYHRLEELIKKPGNAAPGDLAQAKEKLHAWRMELIARTEPELDRILDTMAKESGYDEIRRAPLLTISHSMGGLLCWFMPFWVPERMWGSIPIKTGVRGMPPPEKPDARMDGVPLLYMNQIQPEGPEGKTDPRHCALKPGRDANHLIGQVFDWGGSHFEMTDGMAQLAALFIRKAARCRLSDEIPAEGPAKLKPLKPEMGWLATSLLEPKQFPMAPEPLYQGDKSKAFWYFDEEMAKAAANHHLSERKKKPQYITVVSNGTELKPFTFAFDAISIPVETGVDDGLSFKLTGRLLDTVPSQKLDERQPAGHAAGGKATIMLTGGNCFVQLDEETFRFRKFNRGNGWFVAHHPGDAVYARTNYQAHLWFPDRLKKGATQRLTFPEIRDVPSGTREIALQATSDVPGQVVEYYVVSGPAVVTGTDPKYTGSTLRLTPIPPGAKFPVKVIVVAYQMGRSIPPLVQSADEVVREFHVTGP